MKNLKLISLIISTVLLALSLLFLLGSMVVQAIFNSQDIAQFVEVAFALISLVFAFVGIILLTIATGNLNSLFYNDLYSNAQNFDVFWLKLSFVFAIVALVSVTLLRPIGENIGDVILGGIVVSIIIGLGIFAVNKLAGIENIDNGTNALIKIAGVFTLIALVTDLILIPIGKKVGDAILGASVVLIIEGLLIAGVYLLTKVKRKNIEQSIQNLAILTMIYIGIALVTKLILIPIGKHLGDAMLGAAVTILITGALILGV